MSSRNSGYTLSDHPWSRYAGNQVPKPRHLSITTRGIGFGVCHFVNNVQRYLYHRSQYKLPTIYTLYRVYLGLLEYKLYKLPRSQLFEHTYEYDINKYLQHYSLYNNGPYNKPIPEPIKTLLEAVGTVNVQGTQYITAVAKEIYENGQLVPRPENMLLSNLRRSVEALSSETTPLAVREEYYKNSAIPGAIWDQTLLRNPDDIIPQDYDHVQYHADLNSVTTFLSQLRLKKIVGMVDLHQSEGNKSIFVSNKMQTLRVPDRKPDEELEAYYTRCHPEGRIYEFYGLVPLNPAQRVEGQMNLLGEYPDSVMLRYPVYHLRDGVRADKMIGSYSSCLRHYMHIIENTNVITGALN